MTGIRLIDSASDGPKPGMPVENLLALKEFLRARRQGPSVTDLPEELKALPGGVQIKLRKFLSNLSRTKFLSASSNRWSDPDWNVSSAETWEKARKKAEIDAGLQSKDPDMEISEDPVIAAAHAAGRDKAFAAAIKLAHDYAFFATHKAEMRAGVTGLISFEASLCAGAMAAMIVVSDLEFDGQDEAETDAESRWGVWDNGFGLLGTYGGVLYAYCVDG